MQTNDDYDVTDATDAHALIAIQRREIDHFDNVVTFMTYDDALYQQNALLTLDRIERFI